MYIVTVTLLYYELIEHTVNELEQILEATKYKIAHVQSFTSS